MKTKKYLLHKIQNFHLIFHHSLTGGSTQKKEEIHVNKIGRTWFLSFNNHVLSREGSPNSS